MSKWPYKLTPNGIRSVDPPNTFPKPESFLLFARPAPEGSGDTKLPDREVLSGLFDRMITTRVDPPNSAAFISPRRADDTDETWLKRCAIITNLGAPA